MTESRVLYDPVNCHRCEKCPKDAFLAVAQLDRAECAETDTWMRVNLFDRAIECQLELTVSLQDRLSTHQSARRL